MNVHDVYFDWIAINSYSEVKVRDKPKAERCVSAVWCVATSSQDQVQVGAFLFFSVLFACFLCVLLGFQLRPTVEFGSTSQPACKLKFSAVLTS